VFFGVLTSGYISRWGLKVKSAWIESMVSAAVLMRRDEYLCSIGCEELPQSVLGPVLEEIVRKIDVLTVEMAKFMETNKKRELTREEKLYKEIRIGKVKDKVRAIAREKAVELVNAELWRQKELGSQSGEGREGGGSGGSGGSGGGLVYDMKEVYEKEKIEEAERKKQEEEKKNKMFGVKDKNKETQQ
jgi:hypothetical protein